MGDIFSNVTGNMTS